ncbi:MAG: glycosyltransferase [Cellulosilyticaceae bacterium]
MTQVKQISNPQVSIVVVAQKNGGVLKRSIDSILAQTYQYVEVILVDDGKCNQITLDMQRADSQYQHMHYVKCDAKDSYNQVYNEGIEKATGTYIAILKLGDVMENTCIEKYVQYLQSNTDAVMVYSDMSGVKIDGDSVYESYYNHYKIQRFEEEQTAHLLQSNFVLGHTLCMRSSIKDAILPVPNELKYEDWWIAVTGSIRGKIGFINQVLITHYISDDCIEKEKGRKHFMKQRVEVAKANADYYDAFINYCRTYKLHYLAVIQPMALRDRLMSEYSLRRRWQHYYSEATYRCHRKIRMKERIKIWAYLWCGPYLLLIRK